MDRSSYMNIEAMLLYKSFIEECRNKNYDDSIVLHKHHIIPRCIDPKSKIVVKLSVEDHVKAHLLLADCFEEGSKDQIDNLRSARLINSKSIRDKATLNKIAQTYIGPNNPFYGKTHSKEFAKLMAEINKRTFAGKSYEELYGKNAEVERDKRRVGVKSVWQNRTKKQKEEIIKKLSEKNKGKKCRGDNPAAYPLLVNGQRFVCLKDALEHFNTTRFKLFRHYNVIKLKK